MVPAPEGYAAVMEPRPARPRRIASRPPSPSRATPERRPAASSTPSPAPAAPRRPNDPLDGIERLLIDGSNLLHAMRRGAAPAPAATLIGRLRGVIPMPVRIELLFDGPPDQGLRDARIASGLVVRYSGRLSADALLVRMVAEAVDPGTLLVVSDDVELRHELTRRGGHTAGTRWLIDRLARSRLSSASIGQSRPPSPAAVAAAAQTAPEGDEPTDRAAWRPGRGATTKHGNPKRRPRAARDGPRR